MYQLRLTEFKNVYVDNLGNVFTLLKDYTFKAKFSETNNDGYTIYIFRKNGKKFRIRGHRLVAKAFIPNPENKPTVDHINRIRNDNRLENLRWATLKEQRINAKKGRVGINHYKKCKRIFPHILKPIK